MAEKLAINPSKTVLIVGAGVVGLTLAQGLREAGIPFQIFEQHDEASERSQGWGLTLHWSLNSLERTIGPQLAARLSEVPHPPLIKRRKTLTLATDKCRSQYR